MLEKRQVLLNILLDVVHIDFKTGILRHSTVPYLSPLSLRAIPELQQEICHLTRPPFTDSETNWASNCGNAELSGYGVDPA